MQLMTDHLKGEIPTWNTKYRIQAKNGSWRVYRDFGKVTERNKQGAPLFLKGIVFDITQEEQERDQLMIRNQNLSNQMKKDTLTSLYNRTAVTVELAKHANQSKNMTFLYP